MATPTLQITPVSIDGDCVGSRWEVSDSDQLAKIIAIVAMGQATAAADIITKLLPAAPAFKNSHLIDEAITRLTKKEGAMNNGYPVAQRDGFMFEVISWISARQQCGPNCFLKDPHTSATSQGLDGLMIELDTTGKAIERTTIFEDKCSENPRNTFTQKVIPAFSDRHKHKRSAELVAIAASLIKLSGLNDADASRASQKVMDLTSRHYKASFAVTIGMDDDQERTKLFKGYGVLEGITSDQRIGACLITGHQLRDWFDELAKRSQDYLNELKGSEQHV